MLGKTISWTSQAGGVKKTKKGRVVYVGPAGETPTRSGKRWVDKDTAKAYSQASRAQIRFGPGRSANHDRKPAVGVIVEVSRGKAQPHYHAPKLIEGQYKVEK